MRVVVTGAGGLLGSAIVREFSSCADVVPLTRERLDITNAGSVASVIAAERPTVVINCAAYNDVDRAEEEPVQALQANALAVKGLNRAAAQVGATFIHYSSDFVFDGETDRPYSEEDRPNPQSVYAASKLLGEWLALEGTRSYVLRVESLFGPAVPGGRRGSLAGILDRIAAGTEVPVFVDRVVSPGYTVHLARAARCLLDRAAAPGLYHCVNAGHATWAAIAERCAQLRGTTIRTRPITLATAGLRARRPRYSALSIAKLTATGCPMPTWEEALAEFLSEAGSEPHA